ncbi:MAG: hypothetical protein LBG75_03700 [Candidatus Nomurabacteria bacterium]|jgi:hypothetical protein|nr:hypothetical protein [Candidatus Nomurabacteria bacterium]
MKYRSGEVNVLVVVVAMLSVFLAAAASLAVWAYISYSDQKNNVDSKISEAVATAKKTQADEDEAKFAEREKNPRTEFVGPEDYGRLTFDYPKTWSMYDAKDAAKGGDYEAYLNPGYVPPVSNSQIFALRVSIYDKSYDSVVKSYDSAVKKGDLRSTPLATVGKTDLPGVRFDGAISKDMRGVILVLKLRDKTVMLQTDSEVFRPDFEAIIKTIGVNQ